MLDEETCLMKQFSLLEITSAVVLLAVLLLLLQIFLESSMSLTQLHFKLPTGAHMPLLEC